MRFFPHVDLATHFNQYFGGMYEHVAAGPCFQGALIHVALEGRPKALAPRGTPPDGYHRVGTTLVRNRRYMSVTLAGASLNC